MKPENIKPETARRKREAVRGVVLFALIQAVGVVCFTALCLVPGLPGWLVWIFALMAVLFAAPLIPALAALRQRFREIEEGELDQARIY